MKKFEGEQNNFGENPDVFPVIGEPEMRRFIARRNIRPEDFATIQKLSVFPNVLLIELAHNLFNMDHERSGETLERYTNIAKREDHREIYRLLREFFMKYDWTACHSLVRILEDRIGTPTISKWNLERDKNMRE